MEEKDVYVEQLALAKIEATIWQRKLDKYTERTTKWYDAIEKRDAALDRIDACKYLLTHQN